MESLKPVFREHWSPMVGGLLIGFLDVLLFTYETPWAVYMGIRNWGLHILEFLGWGDVAQVSPFIHESSVMNIAFLVGAFSAAMLANGFTLNIPPLREALKGAAGGVLMGMGATLAAGCTIGGFYNSLASLSASGLYMMAGLAVGTVIGLYGLMWEKRLLKGSASGGVSFSPPPSAQTALGVVAAVSALFAVPYWYEYLDHGNLAMFFIIAALLGFANHRSRFCVVRAFREPFMTGDAEMTKAVIASLAVAISGFAALKFTELRDPMTQVAGSAGMPALAGGVIFGVGMMLAGGCATGSLWRVGEGHVKLAVAVFFFSVSAAATQLILQFKFDYAYNHRVFLPEAFGSWRAALLALFGVLAVWYFIVAWNERTEKLVLHK